MIIDIQALRAASEKKAYTKKDVDLGYANNCRLQVIDEYARECAEKGKYSATYQFGFYDERESDGLIDALRDMGFRVERWKIGRPSGPAHKYFCNIHICWSK